MWERIHRDKQATVIMYHKRTGFHLACENGHTETVKLLLACKDVDVTSKNGVSHQHSELHLLYLAIKHRG